MNKQDLVEALSDRLQKSQREASETIDALVDEIKKALSKGEAIRISGFGAFEQSVRSARQGRNPRTGEPVKISATRVVRFRPAADFKAIVAGTRKAVSAAVPGGGSPEQEADAPAAAAPAKKATAKKATVKKTAARKTASAAGPKSAGPAKAPAAKRAAASKRPAAKRAPAAAEPAGAAPAKKAAARKPAASAGATAPSKRATAKRTAAKKQAPAKAAEEAPARA